ncbi:MAG: hypothetical protein AAGJ10_05285 [Bacteroidota bacterium]
MSKSLSRYRLFLLTLLVLSWSGCDAAGSLSTEETSVPEPEIAVCDTVSRGPGQFSLTIENRSDYRIDSVSFDLTKQNGDYDGGFLRKTVYRNTYDSPSFCPQVIDLTYTREADSSLQPWGFYIVNVYGEQWLRPYQPLRAFALDARHYTYNIRVERRDHIINHSIVMDVDDRSHSTLGVRIVNAMDATAYDIRAQFPDTTLSFSLLAPGDSTAYYTLKETYRFAKFNFIVGTDSISGSPIDAVGEPLYTNGLFSLRLDTLHVSTYHDAGELVLNSAQ